MKYQVGQKIYYRGDMANRPGWFEISEAINNDYFQGYDLKEIGENEEKRTLKRIFECSISEIDKGNSSTRFVTEEAYKKLREQQQEQIEKMLSKYKLATYIEELKLSQPVEKEIARLVNRVITNS